jgi:hypothetical protein
MKRDRAQVLAGRVPDVFTQPDDAAGIGHSKKTRPGRGEGGHLEPERVEAVELGFYVVHDGLVLLRRGRVLARTRCLELELCVSVAPRSYWQYFGTYIWFVIIGLRPLGQFLCAIVEEQLQEALLVMPVMTQRFSRNVSELQYHEDGVGATPRPRDAVFMIVREPPRLASEPRDRGTPRNGSISPKRPPTSS